MLGLGGVAAATGLAAGAKALGGKVAATGEVLPEGTLWGTAQFIDGQLIDSGTPLELKTLTQEEMSNATGESFEENRFNPVVTVTCGDKQSIIKFADCSLELRLVSDPILHLEHGMLDKICEVDKSVEVSLSGTAHTMKGDWIADTIRDEGPFDMRIVWKDQEYFFKRCEWYAMDHDVMDGYITVDFICEDGYDQTVR